MAHSTQALANLGKSRARSEAAPTAQIAWLCRTMERLWSRETRLPLVITILRSHGITQVEVSIRPSTGPVKQPPTLVRSTTAAVSLCRVTARLSSQVTQSAVITELLQSRASTRMGHRTSDLIKTAK